MLNYVSLVTTIILICLSQSEAQYDDKRCICICPKLHTVINTTQSLLERQTYVINVPPSQCKCEDVVLLKVGDQLKGKEEVYCSRCFCKYENRNTTIIKDNTLKSTYTDVTNTTIFSSPSTVKQSTIQCTILASTKPERERSSLSQIVVILVIWVISLLVIYMLFLICLDPLLNKRIHKASTNIGYHEHNNEEDDASIAPGTSHPMGERGNVLNRVGHQQDKWKRQVREQRRIIYDRHTMLN